MTWAVPVTAEPIEEDPDEEELEGDEGALRLVMKMKIKKNPSLKNHFTASLTPKKLKEVMSSQA